MTPQFIYYVIPLSALLSVLVTFGLLSRSSELSVMKACGISLYRITAPLLMLSVVWSGVLYGLEQQIMAKRQRAGRYRSTRRSAAAQPRTLEPVDAAVGHRPRRDIYHYDAFDALSKAILNLTIYRPAKNGWALESQLFAATARYRQRRVDRPQGLAAELRRAQGRLCGVPASAPCRSSRPTTSRREAPVAEMMTVPELKRYIDELGASGFNVVPLTIDLQKKLAFPFVTVVMTLLAIPFGMTTGKRGTLYGIGIGIVLALCYWIVGSAFAAIGKAGVLEPDHGRLGPQHPRRRQCRVSAADRPHLTVNCQPAT